MSDETPGVLEDDLPRRRTRRTIEPSHYIAAEDAFAPAPAGARSRSRSGFMRRDHEFDRDGRCYWCGAIPAAVSYPGARRRG